jgi:hypothetical protein
MVKGEQWYEFHWEVVNTNRVKLFKDGREMRGRTQLRDGSIGWPLSMSGSLRSKLTRMTTFELVAENRAGKSASKNFTVKVSAHAPPKEPPAPRIVSFRVSPSTVKEGDWIKFFWVVENAKRIRLYDDVGEIDGRGWDLRENGAFSTTIRKTTTFRLLADNRAGRAMRKAFTVRVAKSKEPQGTCSIWGRLKGKWRQRVKERPKGPASMWTVEVFSFVAGSNKPINRASVTNGGVYRFRGLRAGKKYTVRPAWASIPLNGNVSCRAGRTHKGPEFRITGHPLID